MAVYAVILRNPNEPVAQRLAEAYSEDDYYVLSETTFLVKSSTIAERVAVAVGIKGDKRIEEAHGVVFKLNASYAGFTGRDLWDWLGQAESPV